MAKQPFQDPFEKLFGSSSRVRLLRLFLFNPKKTFTASDAGARVRVPTAEASRELRLLCETGLLRRSAGKTVRYSVDERFPFFSALQQMLLYVPLRGNDVYTRVRGIGSVKLVVLAGIFCDNFDGKLDVLVVGDRLNERKLRTALKNMEADIGTELHYASFPTADFLYRLTISDHFVRDVFDYPHRIVFDKLGVGLK